VERERVERVRVELGEEGPRKEPVVKPRHQGSLFDVPRFMPRAREILRGRHRAAESCSG